MNENSISFKTSKAEEINTCTRCMHVLVNTTIEKKNGKPI